MTGKKMGVIMGKGLRKMMMVAVLAFFVTMSANGQVTRHLLTPTSALGIGFNADTNHPLFSGSLRLMMEVGKPSDYLKLNFGVGYRGYFDRKPPYEFIRNSTWSDWLLYSKENESEEVRPVGGQVIVPVEAYLRILPLGDDVYLSLGCGAEFGVRLYQSKRYGRYYCIEGEHIMKPNSLSFYPLIAIEGDIDEGTFCASLYWRHHTMSPFDYKNVYDPGKFDALNYLGFQLSVSFEL